MADQFDAVIHLDETPAVEPLERTARWASGQVPDLPQYRVMTATRRTDH